MGADILAENIPNAPKLICPSPKVWDFDEKGLYWVSVVRGIHHTYPLDLDLYGNDDIIIL
jgi:hypothetical protein